MCWLKHIIVSVHDNYFSYSINLKQKNRKFKEFDKFWGLE